MAKTRDRSTVRWLGVIGRRRSELLVSTALQASTLLVLALPASAQLAPNARPVGGSVAAGDAGIARTATTTIINQASQRAAIDWQSFNVGSKQAVKFNQPSTNAVALNRVTGPDPSQIAGRIDANGQIVLVNQAGVTFYKGAQVTAQSLIVTSANVSNANFMAGNMAFDQVGNPNASVTNHGEISVKQTGLAALVAPHVANSGTINAKLGHVVLAGAKIATLDLYGDGLLALDVSNQVTSAPIGRAGTKVAALVTNTGVIRADGGTVQLTAAAADGVLQNLVQSGGKIATDTVGARTGTVTIAGIGGSVTVTGRVSASGRATGTMGGEIAINASRDVVLTPTAHINASGGTGGGMVAIGTTLQRAAGNLGVRVTQTAANVAVRKGARITASSTGTGNGGNVAVLSGGTTLMDGTITAKGGARGGDGGLVEVSGGRLELNGKVDVLAPAGLRGTILLDPTDLAIIASTVGTSSSVDGEFSGGTLPFSANDGTPSPSTLSATTIQNLGSYANVVIQATGTIDVQTKVAVLSGLTLQAGGNLKVEVGAPVQATGGILLQAGAIASGGALITNDTVTSTGGAPVQATGGILLQAGAIASGGALIINDTVTSTGGAVQLKAGTGGIALNANVAGTMIDLNTTGGGVIQAGTAGITASLLQSSSGVTGTVSLLGTNAIASLGSFTVTSPGLGPADFQMTDTSSLFISGRLLVSGGNVYLASANAGGLTIAGLITASGRVGVQADTFGQSGGGVTAAIFELAPFTPGNAVTLGLNASGLSLPSLGGLAPITATMVRIGAVTPPSSTTPSTTAGSITIGSTFNAAATKMLELDAAAISGAKGVIGQAAPLLNVSTLVATGASITLINTGNQIANSAGITASAGNVIFVDGVSLALNGAYSGNNLFFEVAAAGGALTVGASGPATLTAGTAGRISLVADGLSSNTIGSIGGADATVELAPFSPVSVSMAGGGGVGMLINAALLSNINVGSGTLLVGGFTNVPVGGTAVFTNAAAITLDGAVNLTGRSSTLRLLANGSITEPGGPLNVGTVTGGSIGDFSLNNVANQIQASTGIVATGGNVIVADDPTLLLTGLYSGNNLFFQVTLPGGSLALGNATSAATLVAASGGRISLVADGIAATAASKITAPAGTLEVAPFSAINESVAGTNNSGQLLVDRTLLSAISGGTIALNTLLIGGYTNTGYTNTTTGGTAALPTVSASGITLDGVLNLTGRADNLGLLSNGPVTEPGGPVTVPNVFGSSIGTFALTHPANAIGQDSGIMASKGDVVMVDGIGLTLIGSQGGNNLFFQVTLPGGSLALGNATSAATLVAASGGRISLVADGIAATAASKITAPAGTLEVAPFSAINESVAGTNNSGQLLVDRTLLSAISGGTIALNTLLIGGYTNTGYTNTTTGGTAALPTVSASGITLDGVLNLTGRADNLGLLSNGPVTEPGGPVTVPNVFGSSIGTFALTHPANAIGQDSGIMASKGDVVMVDGIGLTLIGSQGGNNLFFQVTLPGGSLALGNATSAATLVAASGGRISLVADGIAATAASKITAPAGTLEVAPFSAINESVAGTNNSGQLLVDRTLLSAISGGTIALNTLLIGGYTNTGYTNTTTGGTAALPTVSASGITLDGVLNLTGRADNLGLLSNGPVTEPGGPVTVPNVFGSSIGTFALTHPANAIGQDSGIMASKGDVVMVDGIGLTLIGSQGGNNLFFQVTLPGGSLALGNATSAATLVAASGGRISLVADGIAATAASKITAPAGTLEVAPFSAINESVAGTNNSGQLLVDRTLLSAISGGTIALNTLLIGGYTNTGYTNTTTGGTAALPTVSASGITLDGVLNLTGRADNLGLLSNGPVTEPGGPVTVPNVFGSSIGTFALTHPANAIGQDSGIMASKGDVVMVDGIGLTLIGSQGGNNLFFQVTLPGGSLALGNATSAATLVAASGGRISLVADGIAATAASKITAPAGTLEVAPFSAINTSLLGGSSSGQLLIDQPLLSSITSGLSMLVVGGFTNVPGGATSSIPSASSISVDGLVLLGSLAATLNFEAAGQVTQIAPIINIGTLTGTTRATTLANINNTVGTLGDYTAGNGFALSNATNLLIAGTVAAGPSASFTVAGALTETGGITASVLSGIALGTASLIGNNFVATLNGFSVSGTASTFTLNNSGNLLINGILGASRIFVSDPSARISLGNGAQIVTGGSVRPSVAVAPVSLLPQNGGPGALFQAANFTQIGHSVVTGPGGAAGSPSTLQISVTGNVQFDAVSGLSAPGTWLILNLINGTATGGVFVNALDLSYAVPGAASLFGSINGVTGPVAASLGFIHPAPDPSYTFNNCEIANLACGVSSLPPLVETVIFVPIQALLTLVSPALVLDPEDNDTLLQMPVVAKEDY